MLRTTYVLVARTSLSFSSEFSIQRLLRPLMIFHYGYPLGILKLSHDVSSLTSVSFSHRGSPEAHTFGRQARVLSRADFRVHIIGACSVGGGFNPQGS